jgi:hypothetical protein
MTIRPSDFALHTPPWISSHVSSDKWTRGVAIELTGALSLAALTDGCHALAHSVKGFASLSRSARFCSSEMHSNRLFPIDGEDQWDLHCIHGRLGSLWAVAWWSGPAKR